MRAPTSSGSRGRRRRRSRRRRSRAPRRSLTRSWAPASPARSANRSRARSSPSIGLAPVFGLRLLEAMTAGLPDDDGSLVASGVDAAIEHAERAGAVVLGPGLGRAPSALAFARDLTARIAQPLVLDADGLNAHAGVL